MCVPFRSEQPAYGRNFLESALPPIGMRASMQRSDSEMSLASTQPFATPERLNGLLRCSSPKATSQPESAEKEHATPGASDSEHKYKCMLDADLERAVMSARRTADVACDDAESAHRGFDHLNAQMLRCVLELHKLYTSSSGHDGTAGELTAEAWQSICTDLLRCPASGHLLLSLAHLSSIFDDFALVIRSHLKPGVSGGGGGQTNVWRATICGAGPFLALLAQVASRWLRVSSVRRQQGHMRTAKVVPPSAADSGPPLLRLLDRVGRYYAHTEATKEVGGGGTWHSGTPRLQKALQARQLSQQGCAFTNLERMMICLVVGSNKLLETDHGSGEAMRVTKRRVETQSRHGRAPHAPTLLWRTSSYGRLYAPPDKIIGDDPTPPCTARSVPCAWTPTLAHAQRPSTAATYPVEYLYI